MELTARQIADRIRRLRIGRNYSQEYMAAKMGISQNAYSKIELCHNKLTVERLLEIALLLEVEVGELLNAGKPALSSV